MADAVHQAPNMMRGNLPWTMALLASLKAFVYSAEAESSTRRAVP